MHVLLEKKLFNGLHEKGMSFHKKLRLSELWPDQVHIYISRFIFSPLIFRFTFAFKMLEERCMKLRTHIAIFLMNNYWTIL